MKKIASLFCLLACAVLPAQDTTVFKVNMDAVDIVRARAIQSGVRNDVPDTVIARLYPAGNLSDLLGSGGMLQLKSYGPGGLSTTSSRGANSMQTPVIWNGINLQNITNNTVDLALLPTFFFDQVSFQPGSTSSAWGSGTIGGAIKTNSSAFHVSPSGKRLNAPYVKQKAVLEYGSFGAVMGGYQAGYGNGKWSYDLRLFRQLTQNNFPYYNIALVNHPREVLPHARIRQHGFLTQVSFSPIGHNADCPGHHHVFTARLWVQETAREIPPTMLQTISESWQQDYALRATLDWVRSTDEGFNLVTRAALIHEGLIYDPGFSLVVSNTDQWTGLIGSEFRKPFGERRAKLLNRASLSGGVNAQYSSAIVSEYIPYTTQLRASAFVSFGKFLRGDDELNISIRQELVDETFIDPVGSFWYYLQIKRWIGVRACVSHNYRVPTFNDLYWVPGGNPDLRAETSWTEELTLEVKPKWKTGSLEYAVTAYNRNVKDMITWAPYASYWSPRNVAEVWSKGMEHRLKVVQEAGQWKLTLLANADYVRSTYEKTEDPDDVAIGKQLIYVPAWFGGASLNVAWKDFFVTYSHQYTDLRFTTRDHVEWLPMYNVANAAIGWSHLSDLMKGEYRVDLFVRCNNLFDVQYQTVAWRPMPGRSFMIGCTIDFSMLMSGWKS